MRLQTVTNKNNDLECDNVITVDTEINLWYILSMINKRIYKCSGALRMTLPLVMAKHIGVKKGDFVVFQEAPNDMVWMYKEGGKKDEPVHGSDSKDVRSNRA